MVVTDCRLLDSSRLLHWTKHWIAGHKPDMYPLIETNADERGSETLHEWVYRQLRWNVISGRFPPGEAVTIRGLAKTLSVSAMPVREALRRLVAERALELQDNRRVRVPIMSEVRFEDLLAARTLLEGEAAERAMPAVSDMLIEQLESIDEAIERAQAANDIENWIVANFRFHKTLYTARQASVFMPLIESLWLQIGPFMRLALSSLEGRYSVDRHDEALSAMRSRNGLALRKAVVADITDGIGHIGMLARNKLLDQSGDEQPAADGERTAPKAEIDAPAA